MRAGSALGAAAEVRTRAGLGFFEAEAERLARLCHAMAERFAAGGRLIAVAGEGAAGSDARHVAVEFVHPVIVGKRALPALALIGADLRRRVELLAGEEDLVMGFGPGVAGAVSAARGRGALTIGFGDTGAEWELDVSTAPDPFVGQEIAETAYHVLWELVHVFFEHRGLLGGTRPHGGGGAGASSFLYPFLADARAEGLEGVIEDVRRSVLMKSEEIAALREQTLWDNAGVLADAAAALRGGFETGATLLALGNGGSATDAMDVVLDLRAAGRPALDLTEDPAIITAIANDIGVDSIFGRQVIAYGRRGDLLLGFSTSGNSGNLIAALAQARRQGLVTVAMVGYDGGRVAAELLADHVVVIRSEHIPRIQEAQASAYHVLAELVR